jgi:hypothetical protein
MPKLKVANAEFFADMEVGTIPEAVEIIGQVGGAPVGSQEFDK